MSRPGGLDNERIGHLYLDVDSVSIPCQIMVLSQPIYDVLSGNSPNGVEYFADVAYGGVPLQNIDEIYIERGIENLCGAVHIGFHTISPIAGLKKGVEIIVTSGIRYNGIVASQKRFHGRIENVSFPSKGETRGTIDAFDNGKALAESACNAGTVSGDVLNWITGRANELGLGASFHVVPKTAGIALAVDHLLSYGSFGEAIKAVVSAFKTHYAFFSGNNELVILDPTTLSAANPIFTLVDAGVQKYQEVVMGTQRYNRIPYSNYTGYGKSFVTYQVNVASSGESSINAVSITGNGFISGVYNDLADQAANPIASHAGLQNNICQTDEQLQALAASVTVESQRQRLNLDSGYNPFVDLGSVIQYGASKFFISKIKDRITAGSIWKSEMEARAA